MKCTNCGADLADSAKFCAECGTKVVREVFCAQCGTKLSAGAKFCPECGTKVGAAATSEPKAESAPKAEAAAESAPKAEAQKESSPKDNGSNKWLTIKDGVLTKCDHKAEGVVIIPEGVTEIGDFAFYDGEKITEIVIPASVEEIYASFCDFESLRAITVASGNEEYKSIDGVLYSDGGKTLFIYPNGKDVEEFTVPAGVKKIEDFCANESLVSVKLPDSLEKIGDDAFRGCKALESITLPDSLEEIGNSAFDGCKSLESITLPASVTKIGGEAFCGCTALASVVIPDSVTRIGVVAFKFCESLSSITFGGTKKEWKAVEKGENWHEGVPAKGVECSDGMVKFGLFG